MGKYAYLQGSGSTPQVGARMSSYAWLGVVLAVWAGRVDYPASPPTSQHGTLGDFWLMATMATMATLVADLLKNLHLENYGCLLPLLLSPSFFFKFQFRCGHGGHDGRDMRTDLHPRPVHEDAVQALWRRVRDSPTPRAAIERQRARTLA